MLLVSAVLLGTSTFAWFSMNQKVTVTGMEVKTKVSSNLLIAADTIGSTGKQAEGNFQTAISGTVKGYLEPVSTVDGEAFFYTLNATADGAKLSGDWTAYNASTAATDTSTYSNKFSEDYGVTKAIINTYKGSDGPADAYVDYVFQLKAMATSASYINLTKLILVDANPKDTSVAHRVAVFVQDITSSDPTADDPGTLQAIFTETGADNQTTGKAVKTTSTVDTVTYNTYANTTLATIASAGTTYYKVVVRLWLEGEDTTCYNDMFVPLTNTWSLDLEISLNTANTPKVANIAKIWTTEVAATPYWYDGTNVYTSLADAEAGTNGTAKASAAEAVKTAFGIS